MDTETTRRTVIGGAALGMAAAAAPGLAQERAATPSAPMKDPRTAYTTQRFAEQRQPWPALQSKMTPVPDCGETSYRGSGKLTGRRALITGGDSGLGRAAAIAYAREGADVAINYYPTEEPDARQVVDLIRQAGRRAVAIPMDLRTEDNCKAIVARAFRELGGLDILVNNAAYQQSKATIFEVPDEEFDRTFKTNIYAPFRLSKAAIPHMKPGASIINVGSVNSFDPEEELLAYASTKGAIHIFTRALAKQLAKQGIRVNMVAPGPFWTPLQVAGGQLPGKLGEFGHDAQRPLERAGQPAEIAALFVTLASDDTTYTTGSTFGANGGKGMP